MKGNIHNDIFGDVPIIEEPKENYVTRLEEIDSKSLEIFRKETEKNLNNQIGKIWSEVQESEWTYVGMYLLNNKSEDILSLVDGVNILYDVYKKTYVGEKVNMEVYATVCYRDLKLSELGIVIQSYKGVTYAPMLFIPDGTSHWVHGYESNEDLYNKLIRNMIDNYEIISSEGLYVEN